jgi:hypothetical protein
MIRTAMVLTAMAAALAAVTVAGCSSTKKQAAAPAPDPNAFPADYRIQIARFLATELTNRADFRGALISAPVLKPVGASQHYVVCLQFNGHSQIKNKVAIYLAGDITQFIDAKPEQCADAAYQPYKELEYALPSTSG